MIWEGTVETGMGIAASRLVWPEKGWAPGTLNLRGERLDHRIRWGNPANWAIQWWMPIVVPAFLIVEDDMQKVVAGINTADNTVELACQNHLRTKYSLQDGDQVTLYIADKYVVDVEDTNELEGSSSGADT
jgi:hypothetical protein